MKHEPLVIKSPTWEPTPKDMPEYNHYVTTSRYKPITVCDTSMVLIEIKDGLFININQIELLEQRSNDAMIRLINASATFTVSLEIYNLILENSRTLRCK